ncbi:hypothetical protein SAMN05444266_101149 [Chitinophaga jiangningensis]|uniref:DUF3592 domain-containing protein n=1 Tax=Chitinophaga jiangningensis TaxID=1419482 RepID=A0A1M6VC89_9BACT|nr:hypothetical protein [Chitinophaga jiangningensis]SHK78965.1 hypothetical protein SAMN05444266_101149 [Chitinophaga jiangningensis]
MPRLGRRKRGLGPKDFENNNLPGREEAGNRYDRKANTRIMFVLAFLLFGATLIPYYQVSEYNRYMQYGYTVGMKLLYEPRATGKNSKVFKLDYNGHRYNLFTSKLYGKEYKMGDTIKVKYIPNEEHIIAPDANVDNAIWAMYIMGFGSFLLILIATVRIILGW